MISPGDWPKRVNCFSSFAGVDWPKNAMFCASWVKTESALTEVFDVLV